MENLAFVLGLISTVCVCIPPLLKGKSMRFILLLIFSANLLLAVSYILTGAFHGAVSSCIGAAQVIINYFFERKNKPIPVWLMVIYGVSFLIVTLLVYSHATDLIALAAAVASIIAISQKNGKNFRLWLSANVGLWVVYDFISLSFGPLSTHSIQLAITVLGILLHDRNKNPA